MGKRRIRNLQYLQAGEIIGFDTREDRRNEARAKYGIDTVTEVEKGFLQKPDAAIISTPPDLHISYALEAAERGMHFFTEASVMDGGIEDLLEICTARQVVGVPSCTMRYHSGPKKVIELIKANAVGRPFTFVYQSGQWLPDWHPWEDYRTFYVSRRETGACREIVPFELTWLTKAFGHVNAVQAFKAKLSNLDADIDDVYQCMFQFESGVAGFMQVDVLARDPVRHFRLLGSEGTIEWNAGKHEVRVFSVPDRGWTVHILGQGTVEKDYADWSAEEPYVDEMREFLAAVQEEKPFGYTYEEDSSILKVLRAAEESHLQGQRITLGDNMQRGNNEECASERAESFH
jgi:predicted dehydrogenase